MSEGALAKAQEPGARVSIFEGVRHRLPLETYVLGLTVLVWILLAIFAKYFWTTGNITDILRQVSIDAILAFGSLFPIILAGIDLSVGSVAGLSGVIFSMLIADAGQGVLVALVVTVIVGLIIGMTNGWASARLGIPPFIVTLAGLQGYRGLALLLSGGLTISGMPAGLQKFALSTVLHVPSLFLLMLAFGVAAHFLLAYTRTGRYMYAIGSNIESARRVGIKVTPMRWPPCTPPSRGCCWWRGSPWAPRRQRRGRSWPRSPRRWWAGRACSAAAAPFSAVSSGRSCSRPSATAPTCSASTLSGRW
jgi:ABC-type xylose transport system permease subunit